MKYFLTIIAVILLCSFTVPATEITGRVVDTEGHPLPGVSVITDIKGVGTQTDTAGFYNLKYAGTFSRVTFSSVGYKAVQFRAAGIPEPVVLEPVYYRGRDIVVTADRAETGITPIAFDNLSRDYIQRENPVSDVPLLLEATPNLYAYAYSGGGLGPTEYKIRGFDSRRIAVYIDGVPLNDPEDHTTYFVDLPDFAAEVTDIQVQRGVGLSMYGDASFGGSINIASSGLIPERRTTLSAGYGAFFENGDYIGDMRRQTVEYQSGLLDGRWVLTGRYSKQFSDGYREKAWYDGWAYSFSLTRLDPNMTTTLDIYGGPIKYHMAWNGISREELKNNRRYNPLTYDNETDNFNQPHYRLINIYRLSERLTMRNTLFYIRGKGYYEQFKDGRDVVEYNIPPEALTDPGIEEVDLVRQKWVTKSQYGFNPRLDWDHRGGRASFGGSFYYFESEHWGQVVWADYLNGTLAPGHRYYEYYGEKYQAALFVNEHYHLTGKLSVLGSLQLKYLKYTFDQTKMGAFLGLKYDLDWLFLSPRVGLNYQVDDHLSSYVNFAVSSREPNDENIYNADDPGKFPQLEVLSNVGDTLFKFGEPTVKGERVYDLELGVNYQDHKNRLGLNLYWMRFENENVFEGGYDADWREITINIDRSVHAGLELSGIVRPADALTLSGNFAYTYNRITDYDTTLFYAVDSVGEIYYESVKVNYKDKITPLFPEYLGNLRLEYRGSDWYRLAYLVRFVGRQELDLFNLENLALDAYMVSSLSAAVSWKNFLGIGHLTLSARVDNLFNEKFETSGWAMQYASREPGQPVVIDAWHAYIVGAERSFYSQVKLEMF